MPFTAILTWVRNKLRAPFDLLFPRSTSSSMGLSPTSSQSCLTTPEPWTTHMSNQTALEVLSRPAKARAALPHEIVLQIISYQPFWILHHYVSTPAPPPAIRVRQGERLLAETAPLSAMDITLIRQIHFVFRSKDQGWSSFKADYGSYRNSWTWFEGGVIRPTAAADHEGSENEGRPSPQTRRQKLQANRHAGEALENYRIEMFVGSEENADATDDFRSMDLKEGDVVALWACASFHGWENFVETATVELWGVDSLHDMD